MARASAQVNGATLVVAAHDAPIAVGTAAWFAWLEGATAFGFTSPSGTFSAHKERRARGGWYWKAYRTANGRLHRAYLGKTEDLTLDRLNHVAAALASVSAASDVDTAALPPPPAVATPLNLLATKLFVPPARATLIPRPHLFDRVQRGLEG